MRLENAIFYDDLLSKKIMKFVSFFMLFFNAYFLVHNVMLSSIHVSHTIARIF